MQQSIDKLNLFLAKFSTKVNFDKKKDRPLFQRTVESGCIQFCRELIPDFFCYLFPILPLLFDIRSAVTQPPDAFGTLEKLDVRLKSRRDAERFSPCTAHFTIRRECPATASVHLCSVPADACPPGRGNFSKNLVAFCRRRHGGAFFLTKR